ncbi:hypothetical protein S2M10_08380 [Sphingomonas sp. S2M10]|uniref:hypothetical protein n=1 Tax=Sphingomonas sp. S2M10 TaxID=2705010 RepID=UPI001456BC61|nr:hypothetical protein [Sphingomonas sp. S2M10]NLS25863.1 hypothetical protein [Sphingomonas sp. S2M10]
MHIGVRTIFGAALLGGAAVLGGCMDDGYGYGGSRVAVGYGSGYGSPYWGWYGDYYYPGTGAYVYDRYRHRHAWNSGQRAYWEQRRGAWRGDQRWRSNWRDFRGRPGGWRRR